MQLFRPDIYRLNLEQGQFLSPLTTEADSLNCCEFNNHHQLFVCGTSDATVEAWDHREGKRVGVLNCALKELTEEALITDA
jgi:ribosome biogenesis protein ENP2